MQVVLWAASWYCCSAGGRRCVRDIDASSTLLPLSLFYSTPFVKPKSISAGLSNSSSGGEKRRAFHVEYKKHQFLQGKLCMDHTTLSPKDLLTAPR
jgi:hypothetical protein